MIALQQREPTINPKALAWTVGVHILLILFFLWWSYTMPLNQPPDPLGGGYEVNLGTSDNGSGTDQPMSKEAPAPYEAAVTFKNMSSSSSATKEILRSLDPNDPSVDMHSNDETKKKSNTVDEENKRKKGDQQTTDKGKSQAKPRYVYQGATGKGGNGSMQDNPGTNEGDTKGKGDRGVPNGTPGATNYTGQPGNGTGGIGHTLSGRSISPNKFVTEFHEGGTVVIRVTVDRSGNITKKTIVSGGSRELRELAMQKLSQAHFSASPDAPPEQFGTVTISFKTHK